MRKEAIHSHVSVWPQVTATFVIGFISGKTFTLSEFRGLITGYAHVSLHHAAYNHALTSVQLYKLCALQITIKCAQTITITTTKYDWIS